MGLLSKKGRVVAHGLYIFPGKVLVCRFSFLQADDIGLVFIDDSLKLMQANANAVHIKGDDSDGLTPAIQSTSYRSMVLTFGLDRAFSSKVRPSAAI